MERGQRDDWKRAIGTTLVVFAALMIFSGLRVVGYLLPSLINISLGVVILIVGLALRRQRSSFDTHVGPPAGTRNCPHCEAPMSRIAFECPACGEASPAWEYENQRWWSKGENGKLYRLDEERNQWVEAGRERT